MSEVMILARVDGKPVTELEVLTRLRASHGDLDTYRQDPDRWRRMLEGALDAELRDRLLLKAAVESGLTVTPQEVASALERSRAMLGDSRFQVALDRRGVSGAEYEAFLRQRLLIHKFQTQLFVDAIPNEATMRRYYDGHRQLFREPRRAQLERYSFSDRETATSIYRTLKADGDLQQPTGQDAGRSTSAGAVPLQWVAIDRLPAEVREAVDAAAPGEVLAPIAVDEAFHVIRVREIKAEQLSTYKEARPRIEASLLAKNRRRILDDWFEGKRATVDIRYFPLRRQQ